MFKTLNFDEYISEYYDNEMTARNLLHFEAKISVMKDFKEYVEKECYENFKISNSIKLVKIRSQNKSSELVEKLYLGNKLINLNAIFFERINELLRNLFLHFNRHNP